MNIKSYNKVNSSNNNVSNNSSATIAKNTMMLYIRMFLVMGMTLYTSRVVLSALGAENYGVYSVVGGVVAMFGFLTTTMSTCTQRFLTMALGGGGDIDVEVSKVFSTSIVVHAILALVILILSESVGLWFFYNKLVLPSQSVDSAFWVYQLSVVSSMIMVLCVPYSALIIANQRMAAFAYISIAEAVGLLVVALVVAHSQADRLVLYSALVFGAQCVVRVAYLLYCRVNIASQCQISKPNDGDLFRRIIAFAGWDTYGNASVLARTQGVNVLLNLFFGTLLNAAAGIATQVQGAMMMFANNIVMAVRPQIVVAYASSSFERMNYLLYRTSIFTFILLAMLSVPVIIETPYLLGLWLGDVPEYCAIFCRLTLIFNLFALLSSVVMVGIHATGYVKRPSLINGTLYLAVVPISYIFYRAGYPPSVAYIFNILAVMVGMTLNVWTLHKHLPIFSFTGFIRKVALRAVIYLVVIMSLAYLVVVFIESDFLRLFCVASLSFVASLAVSFVELTQDERELLLKKLERCKPRH